MELGKALLGYAQTIGVDGSGKLNRRNITVLLIYSCYFLSSSAYFMFTAASFREYAMCAFIWITLAGMIVGFTVMIKQAEKLFYVRNLFSELCHNGMCESVFKFVNFRLEI